MNKGEGDFFRRLWSLALPVTLTSLVMNGLNMVNVVLVGQLGETPVAAVGLANQIFFLLNLLMFGVSSGAAMFTAQMWGKQDIAGLRKVQGLALALGLSAAALFTLVSQLFPQVVLGLYSRDPQVIALGSRYLRLFAWAFPFTAVTQCYAAVMRSVGDVRSPMWVTMSALGFNTLMSYGLIFGLAGLPALGAQGAALAGLLARLVECAGMLWATYRRPSPAAASLRELLGFDAPFAWRVLRPVLPVTLNEVLWSLGITSYSAIYARIGTQSIAAMNIANSVDNVIFAVNTGMAIACGILVGNAIGAGDDELARHYARRTLVVNGLLAAAMGVLLAALRGPVLSMYAVAAPVLFSADRVLLIISLTMWLRATNMVLILGVMRSGGDTNFALVLDGVVIWVLGVPLAALGAFFLQLPVQWVYLLTMSEELTKFIMGLWRFSSGKWIHHLARAE